MSTSQVLKSAEVILGKDLGCIPQGAKFLATIVEDDLSKAEGWAYREVMGLPARLSFPLLEWLSPRNLRLLPVRSYVDLGESLYWPQRVFNQGPLGSCVENATALCLQHLEARENGLHLQLSRLFLYWNARLFKGQDCGSTLGGCARGVRERGVCLEDIWPYEVQKFAEEPPQQAFVNAAQRKLKRSYYTLTLGHILHSLNRGYPVAFQCLIYESFARMGRPLGPENEDLTWTVPWPKGGEAIVGGHSMVLRGYDLRRRLFLVQNSWGISWGLQGERAGCCWMPFDYVCAPTLCSGWRTYRQVEAS